MAKVFIVAEAGVNHLGDRAKMLALCDAAKAAGADAVKFQAYDTFELMERRGQTQGPDLLTKHNIGVGQPLEDGVVIAKVGWIKPEHMGTYNLLRKAELTDADLDAIAAHCKAIGIRWFASVFDPSQIERVLSRGACALKIGHAEHGYTELVHKVQRAAWDRGELPYWISHKRGTPQKFSKRQCVLCIGEYPDTSPPRLADVDEYEGFSSHYTDYRIPAAAALRGAKYIEFHIRIDENEPEAAWSLSPEGAKKCVELIREYESWL